MMLQLKKSQKAIIRTVKEFTKGEFDKEVILNLDKNGQFPDDIWKSAADLGFLGIHLPENIGGGGMEMTDHMLISESFTRHDSTLGSAVMLAAAGAEWIALFASESLKKKLLADMFEGKILSGCVMPKPGIGVMISESDDENTRMINGEVDHVINGGKADIYLLPIQDPGNGFIVVDAASDGITMEKQYQPLGLRMTGAAKVRFSNVKIPLERCIIMKKESSPLLLAPLRMLIAFLALGTAQGAIDRSLVHIKDREQFGTKIANFQVLRHKIASMETQVNQARSLAFITAENYTPKKPDIAQIAMACLASVIAATQITHEAIQLMGGYGYTVEYEVERFCRDAKTLQMLSRGTISLYDDIADAVIGKVR